MAEPAQKSFPTSARVVIVGGGVMGCGLAYHLAHEGWTDIVLLEKAELTSGSTWHAAGQITHSTSSFALGKCVDYNIGLYSGALEAETGQSVTWHGCGSFRLAYSEDEMDWLRHTLSVGRTLGFNIELVGPDRVAELHPFYNLEGVIGALHTPDDGHVDPSGITQALATGARQLGARIRRCRATDIKQLDSGEWKVFTEQGDITCEHVVNAGGTYARQMGEWSGLTLPMTSMTHHYLVTDAVPEFQDLDTELPVVRDDAKVSGYIRMEQKSGLIGIYEKANPNAVWIDHCPWEAENELFEADYDRIMPWLENAMERMPVLAELGIKREVHGAISHPPDGNPLIGPVAGAKNYWCCCGTQIGIGWGPGLTRELARWMVHGAADIQMRTFDPRRFGDYATKDWQVVKAKEDYCLRHEIPFPHFNRLDGRPVKPSPMYQRLAEKGAVYEEVFGHERPRWFARDGVEQRDHYSFRHTPVTTWWRWSAPRCPRGGGDHGHFCIHQGRGQRPGCRQPARPAAAQPAAAEGRRDRPLALPARKRPYRAGNHGGQARRGSLLPRLRGILRDPADRLPRPAARGRRCQHSGALHRLGGPRAAGAEVARRAGGYDTSGAG